MRSLHVHVPGIQMYMYNVPLTRVVGYKQYLGHLDSIPTYKNTE